ncbi:MAG: glycoside hydrolase family 2 protein [Candidatus Cyclobacteriaceae bacterium M2_1C_046]
MKIKYCPFIILLFFLVPHSLYSQTLLINAYNRTTQSLNGEWRYIVDPYENGYYNYRYEPFDEMRYINKNAYYLNSQPANKSELIEYDFDNSEKIIVPGDWNSQKEKLFYYEGTVWYKKSFDHKKSKENNRVFIYFDAVNYQADVYLNGKKLGRHIGGFTPFNFEITELLKEKDNFLILKVDNKRKKEGVPTLNTDWWNYGGITRDVRLIETSANFINDYFIQLDPKNKDRIKGFISLDGADVARKKVTIKIPQLKLEEVITTDEKGKAAFNINPRKINYWSFDDPYLYDVIVEAGDDLIIDQIGFRAIETKNQDILLNGKPVFLRGISIHEESPFRGGRGYTEADASQLLTWAKELGCNFVRLAHYPHNEHMVRLADQMGMLVWEEIPVYWTIEWENMSTYLNAENQLTELINRDKNRASVIIWSMANETPTSEARNDFLKKLAAKTRSMDDTRLISAALEQSHYEDNSSIRTINDPFSEVVDVLSFNQYIGWYDGIPEKAKQISWKITQNKPVIISEFGAGAKYGRYGDKTERWTEDYQAWLYEETIKMISQIEQLRGVTPWILMDFRSPRRPLPEIQDGWNRKGLISEDGNKKKAFFVLQNYYKEKQKINLK